MEPDKGPDYRNDLEESVINLQENNKDLYSFAMKQILSLTPEGEEGEKGVAGKKKSKGKKGSGNRYFVKS